MHTHPHCDECQDDPDNEAGYHKDRGNSDGDPQEGDYHNLRGQRNTAPAHIVFNVSPEEPVVHDPVVESPGASGIENCREDEKRSRRQKRQEDADDPEPERDRPPGKEDRFQEAFRLVLNRVLSHRCLWFEYIGPYNTVVEKDYK